MFNAGMNAQTVHNCLLNLPALELLGMKLLQDSPHAGFLGLDVPHDTLKFAVVEMIDYGERCQSAMKSKQYAHFKFEGTGIPDEYQTRFLV